MGTFIEMVWDGNSKLLVRFIFIIIQYNPILEELLNVKIFELDIIHNFINDNPIFINILYKILIDNLTQLVNSSISFEYNNPNAPVSPPGW